MVGLSKQQLEAILQSVVKQRRQHLILVWDRKDKLVAQVKVYFEMYDGACEVRSSWTCDKRVDVTLIELWDPAEVHLMQTLDRRSNPMMLGPGDSLNLRFTLNID